MAASREAPATLTSLPTELIHDIFELLEPSLFSLYTMRQDRFRSRHPITNELRVHLDARRDLFRIALLCKRLYGAMDRPRYRTIVISSADGLVSLLGQLALRPILRTFCRVFVLNSAFTPDPRSAWPEDAPLPPRIAALWERLE